MFEAVDPMPPGVACTKTWTPLDFCLVVIFFKKKYEKKCIYDEYILQSIYICVYVFFVQVVGFSNGGTGDGEGRVPNLKMLKLCGQAAARLYIDTNVCCVP